MKTHKNCPICGDSSLSHYINTRDYFLSKEQFNLQKCEACGLIMTNPFPEGNDMMKYYQSDIYFSHPNKQKSIFAFIYNFVKKFNLKYKLKVSTSSLEKGRLLDIGCGSGDFLNLAQQTGWEVYGIEPNNEARMFAQQQLNKPILLPEEINSLPKSSFDLITMWHVLEHVENINDQVESIIALLKPNGRLVVALPNILSYDAKFYKSYWAGLDVPRHLYHFSFDTIRHLMTKKGFKFLKREPLKWDAYYVSLLSERYIGRFFSPIIGLSIGLISNTFARKSREFSSNIYIFFAEKH